MKYFSKFAFILVVMSVSYAYAIETRLFAPDIEAYDNFGKSVAMTSNIAVIGAAYDYYGTSSGAVYLYKWSGNEWTYQDMFTSGNELFIDHYDLLFGDYFGAAVAVSDNYVVIGAYGDDEKGISAGAVYIFKKVWHFGTSSNTWIKDTKLMASDAMPEDRFGYAIALSDDDTLIVGAYGCDDQAMDAGAAYVYHHTSLGWSQYGSKLLPSDGQRNDQFGYSVAISNNHAIIGAWQADDKGENAGAAYIYSDNGTHYGYKQKLTASDASQNAQFGCAVDISDNAVIVGAFNHEKNLIAYGAAYIFDNSGTFWSETICLTSGEHGASNDQFGRSVSIDGPYAVVGSSGDDEKGDNAGAAFVFKRKKTSWIFDTKLGASDPKIESYFGYAVDNHDEYILSGAYRHDANGDFSGAAYIYDGFSDPYIYVAPNNPEVLARGGALTLEVYNTGNNQMIWQTTENSSWMSIVSGHTGIDSATVVIQCDKNPGLNRTGEVIITSDQALNSPYTVHIEQQSSGILSVTPLYKTVPATEGTVNISVLNLSSGDMLWTAQKENQSDSWLTIESGQSGLNDGTLVIKYAENTGYTRNTIIKIEAQNAENSPQYLTIEQDHHAILQVSPLYQEIPATDGFFNAQIKNISTGTMLWHAELTHSNYRWLTITNTITNGFMGKNNGTLNISFDANTGRSRTATVKILADNAYNSPQYIDIKQDDNGIIFIDPDEINLPATKGSVLVKVDNISTGIMNWVGDFAYPTPDWLHFDSQTTVTGVNDASFYIHYDKNLGQRRDTQLVISSSDAGNSPQHINISQDPNAILDIRPTYIELTSYGGEKDVYISNLSSGTMAWTATLDQAWVTLKATHSGTNDKQLTLVCEKNFYATRKATLTIQAEHTINSPQSIEIIQYGPAQLSVSPTIRYVEAAINQTSFQVKNTNSGPMQYTAVVKEEDSDWLRIVSGTTGITDASFTVKCFNNPGYQRSGSIIVYAWHATNYSQTVQVIQDSNALLVVDPGLLNVTSETGSSVISIENHYDDPMYWYAQSNNTWISFNGPSSGHNNAELVVNYTNNSFKARTGSITIFASDAMNSPQTVEIKQMEVKITANDDRAENDYLGTSAAISGNHAIVGAPQNDDDGENSGAAYIYQRENDSWILHTKLIAEDADAGDYFGCAVAISNEFAVVGAKYDDDNGSNAGAAYVYHYDDELDVWLPHAKLFADDGAALDEFGTSLAIEGYTIVVGADQDNSQQGAVYVFNYNKITWQQTQKILASDGDMLDNFGCAVSIDNNSIVVGAPNDDLNQKVNAGAVYVFQKSGNTWVEFQKLDAYDGMSYDNFGCSVAIDDHTIIAGAFKDSVNGLDSGAVYIFDFQYNQWKYKQKITPKDGDEADNFGQWVSMAKNYAVIGAPKDDDNRDSSGSVYIYEKDKTTWSQAFKITSGDGAAYDYFGRSVSMETNYVIVGAPGDENATGAAYIYKIYDLTVLSVAPEFVSIPELSGSFSIRVTNAVTASGRMKWEAETNEEWMTFRSGQSGINDGYIHMHYENNPGPARRGWITVKSNDINNHSIIIEVWQDGLYGRVADTGQELFYDNIKEISAPDKNRPFFGQDASYDIHRPSYKRLTINRDEVSPDDTQWAMVQDSVTGLIWEVKTEENKDDLYTWYDPLNDYSGTPGNGTDTLDYINQLNKDRFGGFSDWRLPTVQELAGIMNIGNFSFGNPTLDTNYFPFTVNDDYWTSTTVASHISRAWNVDFSNGMIEINYNKMKALPVRAVRGGDSYLMDRFILNGDDTVTDRKTGLMWQQYGISSKMNWQEAISYCESFQLADYNDWRFPNKEELRSIIDYDQFDPCVDSTYFPGTMPEEYWSSTTSPKNLWAAYVIDFSSGDDDFINKQEDRYVRVVRGGFSKTVDAGSVAEVTWDTSTFSGDVAIYISYQGGKTGTYQLLSNKIPNVGRYSWTAKGPASVNCMVRIQSIYNANIFTNYGLFTITANKIPVIELKGNNPDTISVGTSYKDPGAYAWNNLDRSDISHRIKISGKVRPAVTGRYQLMYTVTNNDGISAMPVYRAVNVVNGKGTLRGTIQQHYHPFVDLEKDLEIYLLDSISYQRIDQTHPNAQGVFEFQELYWKSYVIEIRLNHPDYAIVSEYKRVLFSDHYNGSSNSVFAVPERHSTFYSLHVNLINWNASATDLYQYQLIDNATGTIIRNQYGLTSEQFIAERLKKGTYRLIIQADSFAPSEQYIDAYGNTQNIINLNANTTIHIPMTASPNISIDSSAFKIACDFQSDHFVLTTQNISFASTIGGQPVYSSDYSGTGTQSNPFTYTWTLNSPYDQQTHYVDETYNYTQYTIYIEFNTPVYRLYQVTYYYHISGAQMKNPQETEFEKLYNTNKVPQKSRVDNPFYPLLGTTFDIDVTDPCGKPRKASIHIPPIPLEYLFIADELPYNDATDYFNIDDVSTPPANLLADEEIMVSAKYFSYGDDALGTGVCLEFYRMSDQSKILYNPYVKNGTGRHINASKIQLPLFVNPNRWIFDGYLNLSHAKHKFQVYSSELGDGVDGFKSENLPCMLQDDGMVIIETNHLSQFGIKEVQESIQPVTEDDPRCFIGVLLTM